MPEEPGGRGSVRRELLESTFSPVKLPSSLVWTLAFVSAENRNKKPELDEQQKSGTVFNAAPACPGPPLVKANAMCKLDH